MENDPVLKIPPKTKILITGATGFTGSHLLRKLADLNLEINAIARNSSKIEKFKNFNVKWFLGNVYDLEIVKKAAKEVEYIFHIAASFREAKVEDEVYTKVNVISTKLLAQEALKNPNFKRFIHTSTIGVHSHIEDPPADENYRFAPDDLYQKTKAEAELWLKGFSEINNLPIVIVRPAAIYGPGDDRLLKLFKMASKGFFPIIDKHNTLFHLIHVDDLAEFYIVAATHPSALNDIFIVGNKNNSTVKQITGTVADTYGKKIRYINIPSKPLFIMSDIFEAIFKPLGIEPPIYRRRVAFFTKDRSFNTSKIQNVLNFTPKYDNETGIRQTAEWYLEKGWINL